MDGDKIIHPLFLHKFDVVKLLFNHERVRNLLSDREIAFLEEKMPELFN